MNRYRRLLPGLVVLLGAAGALQYAWQARQRSEVEKKLAEAGRRLDDLATVRTELDAFRATVTDIEIREHLLASLSAEPNVTPRLRELQRLNGEGTQLDTVWVRGGYCEIGGATATRASAERLGERLQESGWLNDYEVRSFESDGARSGRFRLVGLVTSTSRPKK